VKDAAQNLAEDVTRDVNEDVLGAVEDGSVKVLIVERAIFHPAAESIQHTHAAALRSALALLRAVARPAEDSQTPARAVVLRVSGAPNQLGMRAGWWWGVALLIRRDGDIAPSTSTPPPLSLSLYLGSNY